MSDKIKKTSYLSHVTHYITCWLAGYLVKKIEKEDKDEIQKPEKIRSIIILFYFRKKRGILLIL